MEQMSDFDYLREVAARYENLYFDAQFESFFDNVSETEMGDLTRAYQSIASRGDTYVLSRWIDNCLFGKPGGGSREKRFAQQLGRLFLVFEYLAFRNVPPFSSREVTFIEEFKKANWKNLPSELDFLIDAAKKYGVYISESEMFAFLETASEDDMEMLARTAEKIRLGGKMPAIDKWIDAFPFTEHQESRLVYFLLGLMDHAGLSLE
jgi:hypothetical protein